MSRALLLRDAVRRAQPGRLMLSGCAGAGKTFSALVIAAVLAPDTKPALIDTEVESAQTYADEFAFRHLAWEPPYDPRELASTIRDLAKQADAPKVLIVDSLSHFWIGQGGTLDIADGKFGGWKEATPAHDELIDAMLRFPGHVIGCVREKQAYTVTEEVVNGRKKQVVEKVGMAPIQRDGLDFEFNVAASLDMTHSLRIHKSRARVLANRTFRPGHADEFAAMYLDWLDGGQQLAAKEEIAALAARVKALPADVQGECSSEFRATFGQPSQLLAADLAEADRFIARFEHFTPAAEPAVSPPVEPSAAPETAEAVPAAGKRGKATAEPVVVEDDLSEAPLSRSLLGQAAE